MDSKKPPDSTRARKTRAAKPSPKSRHKPTLSPAAMKKRLEARKPVAGLGTAAADALRETRGDARKDVTDIGAELRDIAMRLKRVESLVIVARMALDGQHVEQDNEVAKLLKRELGDLLFEQIRALENVAAQCDGGPPSDRDDDHDEEGDE